MRRSDGSRDGSDRAPSDDATIVARPTFEVRANESITQPAFSPPELDDVGIDVEVTFGGAKVHAPRMDVADRHADSEPPTLAYAAPDPPPPAHARPAPVPWSPAVNVPPAAQSSGRVLLPDAPAARAAPPPSSGPIPGWVLPYVIGCIALALVGAFVLWTQARVLGHL